MQMLHYQNVCIYCPDILGTHENRKCALHSKPWRAHRQRTALGFVASSIHTFSINKHKKKPWNSAQHNTLCDHTPETELVIITLPSPSRTLGRPSPRPVEQHTRQRSLHKMWSRFLTSRNMCSHLYVVLPKHPQEVQHCVAEGALSSNVGPRTRHSLQTKSTAHSREDAQTIRRTRRTGHLPWWNWRWCSLCHF